MCSYAKIVRAKFGCKLIGGSVGGGEFNPLLLTRRGLSYFVQPGPPCLQLCL